MTISTDKYPILADEVIYISCNDKLLPPDPTSSITGTINYGKLTIEVPFTAHTTQLMWYNRSSRSHLYLIFIKLPHTGVHQSMSHSIHSPTLSKTSPNLIETHPYCPIVAICCGGASHFAYDPWSSGLSLRCRDTFQIALPSGGFVFVHVVLLFHHNRKQNFIKFNATTLRSKAAHVADLQV